MVFANNISEHTPPSDIRWAASITLAARGIGTTMTGRPVQRSGTAGQR